MKNSFLFRTIISIVIGVFAGVVSFVVVDWIKEDLPLRPAKSIALISTPLNGDRVKQHLLVAGRHMNIPAGYRIWVVGNIRGDNRHYPSGRAVMDSDLRWTLKVNLGQVKEGNDIVWNLHAVLADPATDAVLWQYLEAAQKAGSWPGLAELPTGARKLDKVTVTNAR